MPRPANYPLDVTPRFTTFEQGRLGQGVAPVGDIIGVIHNGEGDLHAFVVFDAVREVWKQLYTTTAYADLIDANVVSIQEQTTGLQPALADLHTRVNSLQQTCASLQQTCASLAASVAQIVSFMGVVIPAWTSRKEVEQGDEMGVARQSADALGLKVVFIDDRQVPGFSQDDVVAIDPPAGTLIARGSTVTVTLDIEG